MLLKSLLEHYGLLDLHKPVACGTNSFKMTQIGNIVIILVKTHQQVINPSTSEQKKNS